MTQARSGSPSAQRLICLTAGQRAGTTVLQRALRAGGIVNYGEIFHPEPLAEAAGSFRQFAEEQGIRLVDLTTQAAASAIAEKYIGWLRSMAAPRHFLVDIKLNSWAVLSSWWQYPRREPFFLSYLKRQRAVLIFVWRENLGEQLLSDFIAHELGVWHNLTSEQVAGRTFNAPVERLTKLARWLVRAELDMLDHLSSYPAKIVIRYEDLFSEGRLTERFRNSFKEIAGIDLPAQARLEIQRNSISKRDIIENYEEVMIAISAVARARSQEWESLTKRPCTRRNSEE